MHCIIQKSFIPFHVGESFTLEIQHDRGETRGPSQGRGGTGDAFLGQAISDIVSSIVSQTPCGFIELLGMLLAIENIRASAQDPVNKQLQIISTGPLFHG